MMLALGNEAERLLVPELSTRSARMAPDRRPTQIAVDRLPDYLWRELGFQQPAHPENDPWFRL